MGEFMDSDFEIVEGFFSGEFATQKECQFPYQILTEGELARITTLTSNRDGVLVVKMKTSSPKPLFQPGGFPGSKTLTRYQEGNNIILILDSINDPGNLGTIIRIADWYGVSQIICSPETVDCYNPKVLMATMGSFTRVSIWYTDLEEYLATIIAKNETNQKDQKRETTELLSASQ